jgi:hypothetical protein
MPREQRTRIERVPQVDVSRGTTDVGKTEVVSMPFVTPETPDSAKLAEAFGVAVKAVGKIVEQQTAIDEKKWSIEQGIEGNDAATKYAEELKTEADKLPLEQRAKFMRDGLHRQMDVLREQDVASPYLSSYMNAFVGKAHSYEMDVIKTQKENEIATKSDKVTGQMQTWWENGQVDQPTAIDYYMSTLDVNRQTAGKMYVEQMSSFILEKAQTVPGYKASEDITKYLKITTKDGINYATHTEYGPMIDKLESAVATVQKAALEGQQSSTFAVLYNHIKGGFEVTDLKSAAAAEQSILQSGLKQTQITYLLNRLEDKKKGKLIDDNYQNVANVTNYLAVNPQLVPADLTMEWFHAQGIYNPENQEAMRTLANSSSKQTAAFKIQEDKLSDQLRTNQFSMPGDNDLKRAAVLAEYRTATLIRGEEPVQAYNNTLAKFGLEDPAKKFMKGNNPDNQAAQTAIQNAQRKLNELMNSPDYKKLSADERLQLLESLKK